MIEFYSAILRHVVVFEDNPWSQAVDALRRSPSDPTPRVVFVMLIQWARRRQREGRAFPLSLAKFEGADAVTWADVLAEAVSTRPEFARLFRIDPAGPTLDYHPDMPQAEIQAGERHVVQNWEAERSYRPGRLPN